jgi:SAM-dependent methyltransferase
LSAASDHHAGLAPSPWVARFAALIGPGARVLDLAASRGRHALFFAARGARVLAVDRDAGALAGLASTPGIATLTADLETGAWPLAEERFDAIVVVHYLHRPLFPRLLGALADDGVLIYETFAEGNEAYGRPSNPDFLLARDELLTRLREQLTLIAFEQGLVGGERPMVVQRIAAVGRGRRWPPALPG